MKIPFSPPLIDEQVFSEVIDTLKSGWITTGPKVEELEKEIKKISSTRYAICVNSATSGLMLAMRWFGIGIGDEVIIPAYTYAATALAVMNVGAHPVLVDINNDFNVDIDSIKKRINHLTKAIIPVDFGGWPCDYDELLNLVLDSKIRALFTPNNEKQQKLGRILLLSDSAHSLGAIYKGKPAATKSDMSVFSFHAVKNVTTAEGGAISISLPDNFSEEAVYQELKLMTLNGQTKDAYYKAKTRQWQYDIILQGFKMNMPDICAAIGLAQIRKYLNFIIPARRRISQLYVENLKQYDWAILPPQMSINKETSYHLFPLRIADINELQRNKIIHYLNEAGISVNVHFIPLPLFSLFKKIGYKIEDYPRSCESYNSEISLPIYPQLETSKLQYIIEKLSKAIIKIKCKSCFQQ